jgi:hypothetical protein
MPKEATLSEESSGSVGGDVRVAKFTRLLDGFSQKTRNYRSQEASDDILRVARFPVLIDGFRCQIETWQKSQESTAQDFNMLEVFGVTGDEVRHSMLLAWLLDRRLEKGGTHAQGNLGFRLFLEALGLPAAYAERSYWVRREQAGDESRVDVEVAARGMFIIHIENKIRAAEGLYQTAREWADLLKRAKSLEIPSNAIHAFFLTMDDTSADNPKFVSLSWRAIADVFERFANEAKPPEVRLFAMHCAHALRGSCTKASGEERRSEYEEQSVQ